MSLLCAASQVSLVFLTLAFSQGEVPAAHCPLPLSPQRLPEPLGALCGVLSTKKAHCFCLTQKTACILEQTSCKVIWITSWYLKEAPRPPSDPMPYPEHGQKAG
jgi:hypothetical protein